MDYRLPAAVRERLHAALAGRRNRDACLTLAAFLGRFWSTPHKLGLLFVLDRRALASTALTLSEARIRGAIQALERVGFLKRGPAAGRTHQRTPDGLRRKPIAFTFAADYRTAFAQANARAQATRGRRLQDQQSAAPAVARRPSTAPPAARLANSPKWNPSEASRSIWARSVPRAPAPAEPNPKLEAALDRWREAFQGKMSSASRIKDPKASLAGPKQLPR